MNWKLTNDAINGPRIDDWSEWSLFSDHPVIEIINAIKELADDPDSGVFKLDSGYMLKGGPFIG